MYISGRITEYHIRITAPQNTYVYEDHEARPRSGWYRNRRRTKRDRNHNNSRQENI